ncbi:MAG: endonuclease/exonuclease/phosphatase family protein [Opitutaceae bacterium]
MLRVASFNVENLDDKPDPRNPPLALRAAILRAALRRLDADIVCLQEVHAQELPGHTAPNPDRALLALDAVLADTPYATFRRACTATVSGEPYDVRNLVVLSRFPIIRHEQLRNGLIEPLQYRRVTAIPSEAAAMDVVWERPILRVEIAHPVLGALHVINLHLKSRLSTTIPGQRLSQYSWASAAGWAEGYFLSSLKRVGQALETRIGIDRIFDLDPVARILVCGDFNAEPGEVAVEAICGRVENTGNPDLRPRVLIPCSLAIPETVRFSLYHHGRGSLLDHMLMSQSLLPHFQRAVIHNENLHDESMPFASDMKYPESDHAPFLSEFDVE